MLLSLKGQWSPLPWHLCSSIAFPIFVFSYGQILAHYVLKLIMNFRERTLKNNSGLTFLSWTNLLSPAFCNLTAFALQQWLHFSLILSDRMVITLGNYAKITCQLLIVLFLMYEEIKCSKMQQSRELSLLFTGCVQKTPWLLMSQLPNRTGVTALHSPGLPTCPLSSARHRRAGKCLDSWRTFIPLSPGSSASSEGGELSREGKLWWLMAQGVQWELTVVLDHITPTTECSHSQKSWCAGRLMCSWPSCTPAVVAPLSIQAHPALHHAAWEAWFPKNVLSFMVLMCSFNKHSVSICEIWNMYMQRQLHLTIKLHLHFGHVEEKEPRALVAVQCTREGVWIPWALFLL